MTMMIMMTMMMMMMMMMMSIMMTWAIWVLRFFCLPLHSYSYDHMYSHFDDQLIMIISMLTIVMMMMIVMVQGSLGLEQLLFTFTFTLYRWLWSWLTVGLKTNLSSERSWTIPWTLLQSTEEEVPILFVSGTSFIIIITIVIKVFLIILIHAGLWGLLCVPFFMSAGLKEGERGIIFDGGTHHHMIISYDHMDCACHDHDYMDHNDNHHHHHHHEGSSG